LPCVDLATGAKASGRRVSVAARAPFVKASPRFPVAQVRKLYRIRPLTSEEEEAFLLEATVYFCRCVISTFHTYNKNMTCQVTKVAIFLSPQSFDLILANFYTRLLDKSSHKNYSTNIIYFTITDEIL
jgi:hypothetical protein